MSPTKNSPGIPTLSGIEASPAAAWTDEPGMVRLVIGFGSDSQDRIVGTVPVGRSRKSDDVHQVVAASAAVAGGGEWLLLRDAVFSDGKAAVPVGQVLSVRTAQVTWVALWADFHKSHGLPDSWGRP